MTTSSPGSHSASSAAAIASVAPAVISTCDVGVDLEAVPALLVRGHRVAQLRDAAAGRVLVVAARIAATAASSTSAGPSVSGKPCPRLTASWARASADISAKIVVPKACMRSTSRSVAMTGQRRPPRGTVITKRGGCGAVASPVGDRSHRSTSRAHHVVRRRVGRHLRSVAVPLAGRRGGCRSRAPGAGTGR